MLKDLILIVYDFRVRKKKSIMQVNAVHKYMKANHGFCEGVRKYSCTILYVYIVCITVHKYW
jgi:hypothetical protein